MQAATSVTKHRRTTQTMVEGRSVTVRFGPDATGVTALDAVSLSVEEGEFVSLIGPSGCGKSTFLRVIAGLLVPNNGEVLVGGEAVRGPLTDVGIAFQDSLLLPWRTAKENVLLQADIRRLDRGRLAGRARELLNQVGVGDFADAFPHQMSGGMRQRVSLCRALVHDPALLLLDEPFGALDALTREEVSEELGEIHAALGKTVIFVTHSISEAISLSDRVVVLSARPGRVVSDIPIQFARGLRGRKNHPEFGPLSSHIRELLINPDRDGKE